ncbi:MAG: TrkH family potassium uptake protein [Clostridiales bacterium]|jgi:trk system potassium uptake protein TrkH|nr:TrkH family potassium uptake protein [Clostridiales bacterium]
MGYRLVLKTIGKILLLESILMFLPLIISIIYQDGNVSVFLSSIIILFLLGFLFLRIKTESKKLFLHENFIIVAICWIVMSIFGAVPFILSKEFSSIINSIFESISGFTATGTTILINIENLSKSILFWRGFTQWIGGLGVLTFIIAVLPGKNSFNNMFKTEITGPSKEKLVPKLSQNAKILYLIYISLTCLEIIFLLLAGMNFYDAVIHALSNAGTGGFSNKNLGVVYYKNIFIEIILLIFMILFSINFAFYYDIVEKNFKSIIQNDEFKFYIFILILSSVIVFFDINKIYRSCFVSLRYSVFSVTSTISTSGYAIIDKNNLPSLSQFILFILMIFGGCAGSTSGGLKLIRILIIIKLITREINKLFHPKIIENIEINNSSVSEKMLYDVLIYFCVFIFIIFSFTFLLILTDKKDIWSSLNIIISSLNNIGYCFGNLSTSKNLENLSNLGKIILSTCMIIGRLEIYPVILMILSIFKIKK